MDSSEELVITEAKTTVFHKALHVLAFGENISILNPINKLHLHVWTGRRARHPVTGEPCHRDRLAIGPFNEMRTIVELPSPSIRRRAKSALKRKRGTPGK